MGGRKMKIKKIISLSIATCILFLSIFGLSSCGDSKGSSPKIEIQDLLFHRFLILI